MPDIDLSREGEVAAQVADHHASLTWQHGVPFLQDLGSLTGTRLNGETLPPHEPIPLRPGDHIWLAGCVLVYDVRSLQ